MAKEIISVIVANSNEDLRYSICKLINGQGDMETIGHASNGLDLLTLIQRRVPDVVVLDYIMPYLNGPGVLSKLPQICTSKVPGIVILSSFEQEYPVRDCMELGADYYILKPFDCNDLLNALRSAGVKGNGTELECNVEPSLESNEDKEQKKVVEFLYSLQLPIHLKGTKYIEDAILSVMSDFTVLTKVTQLLYPNVAEKNGTSVDSVEGAIRSVIKRTWTDGNQKVLSEVFKLDDDILLIKPPTNAIFIGRIAEYIKGYNTKIVV